ncbi:MAG: agmatine deiminase family protein [Pseudanabaenaceae cyanobacterium SKYGB_i_bin29]|nr:agmatine deiminase family protein [Pseudanabaenaceae cyanobacterium SKYG29]MDW8422543.1 agmatine deiminase family protein [Pseudanabaenaceae cyanobacterium SKYGB_i_bin29]
MQNWRLPAEWEEHRCCWLAFPSDRSLWGDYLEPAQQEFLALAQAIGASERLEILVNNETDKQRIITALVNCNLRCHAIPYGDIWLRDTAPFFLVDEMGSQQAACFAWNGWGNKYLLEHDDRVAAQIVQALGIESVTYDWVLEGGAIEVDGTGLCLTTRQCLLNSNRNPTMDQIAIETALKSALGLTKILWLDRGLLNDHTDGHIDTIVRFFAPGKVLCMEAQRCDDPNTEVLTEIRETLYQWQDQGVLKEVVCLPSPGLVVDDQGAIMPASYLNFYISNTTVIVPTYDAPWDEAAVEVIAKCFPSRKTIGLSAKAILTGGGAFHCITKQQ